MSNIRRTERFKRFTDLLHDELVLHEVSRTPEELAEILGSLITRGANQLGISEQQVLERYVKAGTIRQLAKTVIRNDAERRGRRQIAPSMLPVEDVGCSSRPLFAQERPKQAD
jgi:hypothetical protein